MSSIHRALLLLFVALLAGCATLIDGPDRPPSATELIGVYDYGHAGFAETLELRADGTYKRTLHGHLGQDSVSFIGTWWVVEKRIEFSPGAGQPTDSAPEPAETFFHRHRPAFAALSDIKSDKVGDWFVYLPRASK
jgi:hypothetical protein